MANSGYDATPRARTYRARAVLEALAANVAGGAPIRARPGPTRRVRFSSRLPIERQSDAAKDGYHNVQFWLYPGARHRLSYGYRGRPAAIGSWPVTSSTRRGQ